MAVGDVVSALTSGVSTFSYQPAAGVEIMVTSWGRQVGSTQYCHINNGTISAAVSSNEANNLANNGPVKIFINNTNYLLVGGIVTNYTFSGIQIK